MNNTSDWLEITNYRNNITCTGYCPFGDMGGDGFYLLYITTPDEYPSPSYLPTIDSIADRIQQQDDRHSRRSAIKMARSIKEAIRDNMYYMW